VACSRFGDPVDLPDYVIRDLMQLRSWLRHTALSHWYAAD
jgi:hypothetical protein